MTNSEELVVMNAANACVASVLPKVEGFLNGKNVWSTWVILHAFRAGVVWHQWHLRETAKPEATEGDKRFAEGDAAGAFVKGVQEESPYRWLGAPLWPARVVTDAFQAGAKWQRDLWRKTTVAVIADDSRAQQAMEQLRENVTGLGVGGMFAASMREEMHITASNVAVDKEYHWQPMTTCPKNTKVQLLTKGGLPQYGTWDGKNTFYVGWALIPTRRPDVE